MIAKFLDARLRSGGEGITEDELEVILEKVNQHDSLQLTIKFCGINLLFRLHLLKGSLSQVMMLFRYVQAKDVFEAFYKKDLAKRLLLSK